MIEEYFHSYESVLCVCSHLFPHLVNSFMVHQSHPRQPHPHRVHRHPTPRSHAHVRNRCALRLQTLRPRKRGFVLHARVFQHIGPFPARTCMAVLEMLAEVIGAEEFFRLITLAKLVHVGEVGHTSFPIRSRVVEKLCPAVTAYVRRDHVHRW